MRYRQLGRTGITISEIGFGCGNTAGLMIWGTPEERVRVAASAMEAGINYFDTAATYGDGQSEENLGKVLPQLPERPLVGTKVALQLDELADIPGAVRRSVERSLRRLGLDYVDVVHLHNRVCLERKLGERVAIGPLLTADEMLGPDGIQETFEMLQREGRLRSFGFCAFGGDVPVVHRVIDEGRFHSMLAYYNVLNPTSGRSAPPGFASHDYGQVIDRATARGIGTVALRVLDAGALSGIDQPHDLNRGGQTGGDAYRSAAQRAHTLDAFRRDERESLAQVAIRYALTKEEVSTVLVGFSEMRHLEEAVACSDAERFTPAQIDELERLYASGFGVGAV